MPGYGTHPEMLQKRTVQELIRVRIVPAFPSLAGAGGRKESLSTKPLHFQFQLFDPLYEPGRNPNGCP